MEFNPGATVRTCDGQLGTVLEPVGPGRGYLEYTYPHPTSRGSAGVKAYPVLMESGEVRVFTSAALTGLPGTLQ